MKKSPFLLAFVLTLLVCSCAPKFSQSAYYVDYRPAYNMGVFVSESNSVSFDYEPIASLMVNEYNGEVTTEKRSYSYQKGEDIYGEPDIKVEKKTNWRSANFSSALTFAAQQCLDMGGDGLINLNFEPIKDKDGVVVGVTVSGMVIHRK